MSTSTVTTNPVRSDVRHEEMGPASPHTRKASRLWALSGVAAGVLGLGTVVTSSMIDVVYREEFQGTTSGVAEAMRDKAGVMFAFHSITVLGALLMVVFAAGLFRRLRAGAGDSLAPMIAFGGLLGTAVVSVLGAGLDTEIMMPLATQDGAVVPDPTASFYNNWIGTIPWCWVLAGLAGLAVYAASRLRVVPRWIGRLGLVLGGLTALLGVSPLEYLAGVTGALWLVGTSLAFLLGDQSHRSANS
jgi:hypothetical protein